MYEPENQNGFTLEPIIEHLLLQLMFVLLVLETHTTSSQDEPPVMNRTHDTFTQCVKRKNEIQETFEK